MTSPHPRPPTGDNVRVTAHAVEQYQRRVKPALDTGAARRELERLMAVATITTSEPDWLHAANPAPYFAVLSDAVALPLAPQDGGWVATTCVAVGTYTAERRAQRSAHKSSRASARRARRRSGW